jgi:hypothetical protein
LARPQKLGLAEPPNILPAATPRTSEPSLSGPVEAVAQRAIFYEENETDPQNPKATAGRALWRVHSLNTGQGHPLNTVVVRSNVEVPGAGLSLSLALRRNTDQAMPASHIIELTFTTPGDPSRAVRDVGLLQFKGEEAVRGTAVAGLPLPVKDNVFLIGLSSRPGDVERNQDLILRRNWIDLPVRFASGQRAILSFEKGIPGHQMLEDAFTAWAAPDTPAINGDKVGG